MIYEEVLRWLFRFPDFLSSPPYPILTLMVVSRDIHYSIVWSSPPELPESIRELPGRFPFRCLLKEGIGRAGLFCQVVFPFLFLFL